MTETADVVVSYLELRAPAASAAPAPPGPITLRRECAPVAAPAARALYLRVGGPWQWTDRAPWTEAEWQAAIHRDDVELWVALVDEEIVGYFELEVGDQHVELKYFGLLPEFTGRGLGRSLLSAAVDRAWALGRNRMTVNTCTLDHPAALTNYLNRGFVVLRTETRSRVPVP